MLKFDNNIENNLVIVMEYIVYQLVEVLNWEQLSFVLVLGGGVCNFYLMNCLKYYYKGEIVFFGKQLLDFKEVIIFGFFGVFYFCGELIIILSVIGVFCVVCLGVLYRL